MIKGLARFVSLWLLSFFLTPYVERFLLRLSAYAPRRGLIEEVLVELSSRYSTLFVRTFGETVADLVLGTKKK